MSFIIRVCKTCGLRYPTPSSTAFLVQCPVCGSETQAATSAFERHNIPKTTSIEHGPAVYAVLDNIRSAWNVGAIFRTADAAGVRHLYLCGITPTPENPKVVKTALGSEKSVPWTYHRDGLALVKERQLAGERIWALEGGDRAAPIGSAQFVDSVTWVIGNENAGIDPAILNVCEKVFYLPMMGEKESLNVVIAFGAAAYFSGYFHKS